MQSFPMALGSSADSVRTLAANAIAESMKDLQNVVGTDDNTMNISYTMYVYEGSMVTNDNKTETVCGGCSEGNL